MTQARPVPPSTRFTSPSGEELVVLKAADFDTLVAVALEATEVATDVADSRVAFAAYESGLDDGVPLEEFDDWLAASSPAAWWMKRRGLTQAALARASGLSQPFVSKILRGESQGTPETLRKLASALRVTVDALVR
jgi:DNA-binding XRE family transcriptional regulator